MNDVLLVLLVAYILDLVLGDPVYPFHPVRLIGLLISLVQNLFKKIYFFNIPAGGILTVLVILISNAIYLLLKEYTFQYGYLLQVFLVYSLIAGKDLIKHTQIIIKELKADRINEARQAVSMIVGRDTSKLERSGVAKAAIESVAENFTDGVLSPLFWYAIGGLVAFTFNLDMFSCSIVFMLSFKVVSTLDSMIGYRNEKYEKFGKIAAKLDDVLNFIPARISIFILTLSAFCTKLNYKKSWTIGWRDRLKHKSPNAGHSEATVAGALDITLGGTSMYAFGEVVKPTLGDGGKKVGFEEIARANQLIQFSGFLTLMVLSLIFLTFNYLT